MGLTVVPKDRLCPRYAPTVSYFLVTERAHAAGVQTLSGLWPSTTRIVHGARHFQRVCLGGPTATSSMACPTRLAAVVERCTRKPPLVIFASRLILSILFRRFQIGYVGRLAVTVGPRQAIAVHTGARTGYEVETSSLKSVGQVSILFSVNATTTYGEVSAVLSFGGLAGLNHVIEHFCRGQRAATR
jgi:hypothetical protein